MIFEKKRRKKFVAQADRVTEGYRYNTVTMSNES